MICWCGTYLPLKKMQLYYHQAFSKKKTWIESDWKEISCRKPSHFHFIQKNWKDSTPFWWPTIWINRSYLPHPGCWLLLLLLKKKKTLEAISRQRIQIVDNKRTTCASASCKYKYICTDYLRKWKCLCLRYISYLCLS